MIYIVDFEASGLDLEISYPIEAGYAIFQEDGTKTSGGSVIRPLAQWTHWSQESQAIHKFTRSDIIEHGIAIHEVAHMLNDVFKDAVVLCDGRRYDAFWMKRLYEAVGFDPTWSLGNYFLTALHNIPEDRFPAFRDKLKLDRPHRAEPDCQILLDLLIEFIPDLSKVEIII